MEHNPKDTIRKEWFKMAVRLTRPGKEKEDIARENRQKIQDHILSSGICSGLVLGGSYAKHTHLEEFDLDILVILRDGYYHRYFINDVCVGYGWTITAPQAFETLFQVIQRRHKGSKITPPSITVYSNTGEGFRMSYDFLPALKIIEYRYFTNNSRLLYYTLSNESQVTFQSNGDLIHTHKSRVTRFFEPLITELDKSFYVPKGLKGWTLSPTNEEKDIFIKLNAKVPNFLGLIRLLKQLAKIRFEWDITGSYIYECLVVHVFKGLGNEVSTSFQEQFLLVLDTLHDIVSSDTPCVPELHTGINLLEDVGKRTLKAIGNDIKTFRVELYHVESEEAFLKLFSF